MQIVVQRHFGDRRVDQYLDARRIDLPQHRQDFLILALGGADHQSIVGGIGGDANAGGQIWRLVRRGCWRRRRRSSICPFQIDLSGLVRLRAAGIRAARRTGVGRNLADGFIGRHFRRDPRSVALVDKGRDQDLRHGFGAAILHRIDKITGFRCAGLVEPRYPLQRALHFRPAVGDDDDTVQPFQRHDLEGIAAGPRRILGEDGFQFRNHFLRRAVGEDGDGGRLALHPVDIEGTHHIDERAAFVGGTADQNQIADFRSPHRSAPGDETIHQFHHVRGTDIAERNGADAVTAGNVLLQVGAANLALKQFLKRHDLHRLAIADKSGAVQPQSGFEGIENLDRGKRPAARQGDCTLNPRIDDVTEAQRLAENEFRDFGNIGPVDVDRIFSISRDDAGRGIARIVTETLFGSLEQLIVSTPGRRRRRASAP